MLRIIVLIEFINSNAGCTVKGTKKKNEVGEAVFWTEQVDKFVKEGSLFGFTERKRNLTSLYKQLNLIYREKEIFPYVRENESYIEFEKRSFPELMTLVKYIELIRKSKVEQREAEQEL